MIHDNTRKEFEIWARQPERAFLFDLTFSHGQYVCSQDRFAWEIWRAARANVEVNAKRYLFLRNQNIFEQIGSTSPYVVRGQSMDFLEGKELDDEIDAAMK